jgi:glycosyltransferase involved in cell wall biosynthesis
MRALIGIPARNEVAHIREVCHKAMRHGEVYVVNNGSTDATAVEAKMGGAIVVSYPWSGYGRALAKIFQHAKVSGYDWLVTLDGDGQHDPEEIPAFIEALKGADVVIGNRFLSGGAPLHREAVIRGLNHAYGVGDSQCGFRAYNRRAIESIKIIEDGMGASLQILGEAQKARLHIVEIPVTVTYNESSSPQKQIAQGMNLVEALFWGTVWVRPYTYLGVPALALLASSVGAGVWALDVYATQRYLVPSAALLCGVSFLGAVILTSFAFYVTISRRIVKEISVK